MLSAAPNALAAGPAVWSPAPAGAEFTPQTPDVTRADARGTLTHLFGGTVGGVSGVYVELLPAGSKAWTKPQLLEAAPGKISGLKLEVGAGGQAFASWGFSTGAGRVAVRGAGGAWSAPVDAEAFAEGSTLRSPIVVGPTGDLWSTRWSATDAGASEVLRRAAGARSWSVDATLPTRSAVGLRFDAASDVFAAYAQGGQVLVTRKIAGTTTWEPAHSLGAPYTGVFVDGQPNYLGVTQWDWSVNADGDITVVWVEQYGPPREQLKVAQRPIGGAWSAPTTLRDAPAGAQGAFPRLGVAQDRDGRATIVVQHNTPSVAEASPTGAEILTASQAFPGQWPADLAAVTVPAAQQPSPTVQDLVTVAEGGAGHAIATWATDDGFATAVRPRAGALTATAPPTGVRSGLPLAVTDAGAAVLSSGSTVRIADEGSGVLAGRVSVRLTGRRACPTSAAVYTASGPATLSVSQLASSPVICLVEGSVRVPRGAKPGQRIPGILTGNGITPRVISVPVVLPAQ